MNPKQINLASLLLFSAAAPLWVYLTVIVAGGHGFGWNGSLLRWIFAPAILLMATGAIHRLLPKNRNRLALAALLAGVIPLGIFLIVAVYEANFS